MVAGHHDCRFCDGFQADDAGIGDILLVLVMVLRYLLEGSLQDLLLNVGIIGHQSRAALV
jgi:hypothetical protein